MSDEQLEPDERPEPDEQPAESEESENGHEEELGEYEADLARYLEKRIQPNLSSGAIPLVARSIAKEIASKESPDGFSGGNGGEADEESSPPAFEAEMHELQEDLGEEWILSFSVRSEDGWLTAETEDSSQRAEAPDAQRLLQIVEVIKEAGGRQG